MRNKKIEFIRLLNHVFMAYFQNEACNLGVNFIDNKPVESITKDMVGRYFAPNGEYAYVKTIIEYRVPFYKVSLDEMMNKNIEESFTQCMKDMIYTAAKDFAEDCIKYPDSDYIFSMLDDYVPFYNSTDMDLETNFTARTVYGADFGNDDGMILFDFMCLFIEKVRKIKMDDGTELFIPFSKMNKKQHKLYLLQMEKKDE